MKISTVSTFSHLMTNLSRKLKPDLHKNEIVQEMKIMFHIIINLKQLNHFNGDTEMK